MAKKKKKPELVEVQDPTTKIVNDEIEKLTLAIDELDSKISEAVEARTNLDSLRTCMQLGLAQVHKQTEVSFEEEPEIVVSEDGEVTLTFEATSD